VNHTAKSWILRLIGIPVTILIPMLGAHTFMDGCARLIGDSNLIFVSIPALITILWATFRMADWIVFASRADLLSKGVRRIGYAIGIEACLILALWIIQLPEQPYDREALRFGEIKPATVNVTGTWKGSWTDPRAEYKENITLTLEQTGSTISGTIHGEKERVPGSKKEGDWDIIEGQVSSDRINLYYKRRFSFRTDATATLLGVCKHDEMSGEYFGHVTARRGGSSKGMWQASRTQP
jgi:hypothetical protein